MKSLNIPEGQRKLITTIMTMALGIAAEKYLGGLSNNLAMLFGSALALFVGGNAVEHITLLKKAAQVDQEPVLIDLPQEQEEGPSTQEVMSQLVNLDNAAGAQLKQLRDSVAGIEGRLKTQAENIDKIVGIINKLTPGSN